MIKIEQISSKFIISKGTVMMFVGGLIMGIALEHSNLHTRIALKIIIFFGSSYKKYEIIIIIIMIPYNHLIF